MQPLFLASQHPDISKADHETQSKRMKTIQVKPSK